VTSSGECRSGQTLSQPRKKISLNKKVVLEISYTEGNAGPGRRFVVLASGGSPGPKGLRAPEGKLETPALPPLGFQPETRVG